MKNHRFSFLILFTSAYFGLSGCCTIIFSQTFQVKFIVELKTQEKNKEVYLTGSTGELGKWNPAGVPMEKISDSVWTITIPFKIETDLEFNFTAGTWWEKCLNSSGLLYDNFKLNVESDTTITVLIYGWSNNMINGILELNSARFMPSRELLTIDALWKYHSGDNVEWASPNFNDSSWVTTDSYINWNRPNAPKWNNVGWFRFHMYVDSSLWNKTLAININQLGASEIYYNGKFLYSFGTIGSSRTTWKPLQNRLWREIRIDPKYKQLIAVRYANYNSQSLKEQRFAPGFILYMKDLNFVLEGLYNEVRSSSARAMIFTSIPLILFFLHMFLFLFYRRKKQNLFYAFCLLAFAGLIYFNYERYVITDPSLIILYYGFANAAAILAMFFGLLSAYEITYGYLPKRWVIFLPVAIVLIVVGIMEPLKSYYSILLFSFFGLTMIDVGITSLLHKDPERKGGWISFTGFLFLTLTIIYQILINYNVLPALFGINDIYVYGMLGLAVSMSLYLSYDFSYINRNLESQLKNVQHLSAKTIEQEKKANRLELERRLIEAENERKTRELESARELQLSLLPSEFPQIEHLDIACSIKTATEVGGDYFDFYLSDGNILTTVIGDATGHGLKAGNMVIATKGLFNILYEKEDLTEILSTANNAIKKMNLNMLMMCAAVLRINKYNVEYASAGMPPLLIYRGQNNTVEQLVLKAMPLGAFKNFPFNKLETKVYPGDIILAASDGLTELFNGSKEMLGTERVIDTLKENSNGTASEIISNIFKLCQSWTGDNQINDDITVVVIRIK